ALGHGERAPPGILLAWCAEAAGDVLPHEDDARIAFHFLTERFVDRLTIGLLGHGAPPINKRTYRRRSAGRPRSAVLPIWPARRIAECASWCRGRSPRAPCPRAGQPR